MAAQDSRVPEITQATGSFRGDSKATVEALGALFRSGTPTAPSGRYDGEVVSVQPYTLPERIAGVLVRYWMPWLGKVFDESASTGENIVDARFRWPVRVFLPGYRGFTPDPDRAGNLRGFRFRSYVEPSLDEPGVRVVVVDYNVEENPTGVRAARDEIVRLPSGAYLGKACLVTRRHPADAPGERAGRPLHWHLVAYFALSPSE